MEGTTIALLTMNKPQILEKTVQWLQKTLVHPYEVIVVDNNSTDPDTLALLNKVEGYEDWSVVRNTENRGLSLGTNQGLALGKYDCLIHMDDDCVIRTDGWNQTMRSYFEIPEVGMVVPSQNPVSLKHDRYQELRWALGMIWAIRKELFDDIGGYDPQLYHQNECDMALRVRMAGYHLAGIADFPAEHNDIRTDRHQENPDPKYASYALARENIGVVQFVDKWCIHFKGRNWNYGTPPIYRMDHFPPDQEFFRQFALQEGVHLNPSPEEAPAWVEDYLSGKQQVTIGEMHFVIWREIRTQHANWSWLFNPEGYAESRQDMINRWQELTGELYTGYKWHCDPLSVEHV